MARVRRRVQRKRAGRRKTTRTGRRIRGVSAAGYRGAYPTMPPIGAFRGRRFPITGRKRKFRGRSRTGTATRRRTVGDSAGYIQWSKYAAVRKLGRLTQRKMNFNNNEILDLVFKRTGRVDGGGSLWAGNYVDLVNAPNLAIRPIYLFDLTSAITAAGSASPGVNLIRGLSATLPYYQFAPVPGINASNSLANAWQRLVEPSVVRHCTDNAILKWSELKFDLWGCKEHPVEWEITLCQIDPVCLPDPKDPGLNMDDRQGVDFWDQVSTRLCFTPTDRKAPNGARNMIRVMDRRSFVMNPTATYETDTDPHVRSVRLFYTLNRRCQFRWRNSLPADLTLNVDPAQNAGWDPYIGSDQYTTVVPKARVFCMLTCKNWRSPVSGYGGMTTSNTASFNVCITNRWIV